MFIRQLLKRLALLLALGFTVPASVQAGNIWLTGHDADLHCAFSQQCNHFGIALDLGRVGAPTPSLPLLFLTSGGLGGDLVSAEGQAASRARNTVEGAGNPFPFVLMDPTDAAFATTPLSTSAFSAIVIASDETCGGCDNNQADIDAINARTSDIAGFFNAGGGLVYFAGSDRRETYYDSVPIGATAAAVSPPFTLTAAGVALGLLDPQDTDCCATHNAFAVPGPGSALIVAEFDASGLAETLFARSAIITDDGIVTDDGGGPGTVAEPASLALVGIALAALGLRRRRQQD